MDKEARFFERIVRSHYWQKMPEIVEKFPFRNRIFFSKFKRINAPLTHQLIDQHRAGNISIAHSLIDKEGLVPHLVIDYNGNDPKYFYHHAGKVLHALQYDDLITFHSKTPGHIHLYIFVNNLPLQKAYEQGKIIDKELRKKLQRQWALLPDIEKPQEYAIAQLPYRRFFL
ncbi:MAG TPA: DUF1882 domain-containing protein [Sulfuricurvum sp.]|nr:DUF1882 domain-containing protein [Sulfuricurvum sp.]